MEINYLLNIGARKEQQDSCDILQNQYFTLIVLGDGMGGHKGGAIASQTLVEEAKKAFDSQNRTVENIKVFFQSIIDNTSSSLASYKKEYQDTDPRTTAVLALLQDDKLHIAHIGDSRLYLFDEKGLVFRTKDHSVVQMLVNMEEITEDEMATHPDQNKLLKSVNSSANIQISYKEIDLDKHYSFCVLVCSDGFWEYITIDEMKDILQTRDIENALSSLVTLAKQRGGSSGDNISVAVYINEPTVETTTQKIIKFLNKEIF